MAATRRQDPDAQRRSQSERLAEDVAGPGAFGPRAFVVFWLVLMIVGALGVLLVSIPTPVYESGLAALDPALAGLLDLAT